jgi:hypothetical protein
MVAVTADTPPRYRDVDVWAFGIVGNKIRGLITTTAEPKRPAPGPDGRAADPGRVAGVDLGSGTGARKVQLPARVPARRRGSSSSPMRAHSRR